MPSNRVLSELLRDIGIVLDSIEPVPIPIVGTVVVTFELNI